MAQAAASKLSDGALNIIENISRRVAEKNSGRITPSHVLPYLPLSIGIVQDALNQMVDGTTVTKMPGSDYAEYEFTAFKDRKKESDMLNAEHCIGCDTAMHRESKAVICNQCSDLLHSEMNNLAETTGWPAYAAYEHDFLYHATAKGSCVQADALAGTSPYTLRSTRKKLEKMAINHSVKQELDREQGVVRYHFPEVEYPRDYYDSNMDVIMSYPASVMEEIEIKITKIMISLGFLFLAMVCLAFYGIPFPFLLLLLAIIGPAMSVVIWRRRKKVEE